MITGPYETRSGASHPNAVARIQNVVWDIPHKFIRVRVDIWPHIESFNAGKDPLYGESHYYELRVSRVFDEADPTKLLRPSYDDVNSIVQAIAVDVGGSAFEQGSIGFEDLFDLAGDQFVTDIEPFNSWTRVT